MVTRSILLWRVFRGALSVAPNLRLAIGVLTGKCRGMAFKQSSPGFSGDRRLFFVGGWARTGEVAQPKLRVLAQ